MLKKRLRQDAKLCRQHKATTLSVILTSTYSNFSCMTSSSQPARWISCNYPHNW